MFYWPRICIVFFTKNFMNEATRYLDILISTKLLPYWNINKTKYLQNENPTFNIYGFSPIL